MYSKKFTRKNLKQRLDALRNGLQTEYSIAKSKFDGLDQVLKEVLDLIQLKHREQNIVLIEMH